MNAIATNNRKVLQFRSAAIYLILLVSISIFSFGCMNVRGTETINGATVEKKQFRNKRIAIMPVKEQAALSTDSLLSLRTALNEKLGEKLKEKLLGAKVIDVSNTVNTLNTKGRLGTLDDALKTFDSTGVFRPRDWFHHCATPSELTTLSFQG